MQSSSSRTTQLDTNPYHVGYDQSEVQVCRPSRRDDRICPVHTTGKCPLVAQPPIFDGIPPPRDYMMWSIVTCIFCFMPTGLVAVYHAVKATEHFEAGAIVEGEKAQLKSKKFIFISAAIGGAILVLTSIILGVLYSQPHIRESLP